MARCNTLGAKWKQAPKRNFDYINSRGINIDNGFNLYRIHGRMVYFLLMLMFKAIYGIEPNYPPYRIDMHFDFHGFDERTYIFQLCTKRSIEIFLLYIRGKLWNDLSDFVRNSTNTETFEQNYKIYKSIT